MYGVVCPVLPDEIPRGHVRPGSGGGSGLRHRGPGPPTLPPVTGTSRISTVGRRHRLPVRSAVRTPDEVVAYCSWKSNYYTTVNRSCLDRFGYHSRAAPEVPLALLSAAGPGCSFTSSGIRLLSTSFA